MKIQGKISKFIFRSDSGYGVAIFILFKSAQKSITIVGEIGNLSTNILYELEGENVFDEKYNKTNFSVKSFSLFTSNNLDEAIKFLSSSDFPNIGKNAATKVINYFNTHNFELILDRIEELNENKIIDEIKIKTIKEVLSEKFKNNKLLHIFIENNLNQEILRILEKKCIDQEEIFNVLKNNIYEFANNNNITNFESIDKIALCFGIEKYCSKRIAWLSHNLINNELILKSKCSFVTLDELKDLLYLYDYEIRSLNINEILLEAKEEGCIVFSDRKIYTKESFYEEENISNFLVNLSKREKHIKNDLNLENYLEEIESFVGAKMQISNFKYNQEQKAILNNFLKHDLLIVTGGPGTGKTTLIVGIVKLFTLIESSSDFGILAPTGRASGRIKDISGYPTSTIHRFLGYSGNNQFDFNEKNKKTTGLIVLDEVSMIDQSLFSSLLNGISLPKKMVLVGDIDQLPSVSYGNVFEDLINSEVFEVNMLEVNNRQTSENTGGIIELANAIKNDAVDKFDFSKYKDIEFYDDYNLETIISKYMQNLFTDQNENTLNLQIITAMYKGEMGIDNTNNSIQEKIIHNKNTVYKRITNKFYENDKIIFTENNNQKNLFNGDVGFIKELNIENKNLVNATLNFNESLSILNKEDFKTINLAYCISIHKTQGSEYQKVFLVIDSKNYSNGLILNKKTIYTAITRAKQKLIIFSKKDDFIKYSKNLPKSRKTTLKEKIIKNFNN